MLNAALKTLQNAKLDSTTFDFVPEFYIEAICSGYLSLRNLFSPTVPFNGLPGMLEVNQRTALYFYSAGMKLILPLNHC